MTEIILVFRSSGAVIAGERKLLDAGVDVRVMAAPKGSGCGICLSINAAHLGKAKLLLGNDIQSIYRSDENGKELLPWVP